MDNGFVIDLARAAMSQTLLVVGPILLTSLLIGLAVSVFQAVTQINEPTLTFVPKMIGVFAVLALLGPVMATNFLSFAARLFAQMAEVAR